MQTQIMGVLNANEDSFFSNSRFNEKEASLKVESMINEGAHIIDIGAVSSRPGSIAVKEELELKRLKNIVDTIYDNKFYEQVKFSIDSYSPLVINYVLNKGFSIINDITGLQNDEVCKLASKYKAQVIIMHMQNDPETMQNEPKYNDVIEDIDDFFKQRIKKAQSFGIEDIILDVGIGFGKTLEHNLKLIKELAYFKHHGFEILTGASRKSMINKIYHCEVEQRLPGTLAIHQEAVRNGSKYIRCHDVKEHVQAIKVFEAINSI